MSFALFAALLLSSPARAAGGESRGRRALQVVQELVKSGHRYAGAPKRDAAIAALEGRLKALGLVVERDGFVASDPRDGAPRPMVNLVARFRVGSSRVDLQACKLEYSIVSPK